MIDMYKEQKILFLGDSITHNGLYTAYLDVYLKMNFPKSKLDIINLGLTSENLTGITEDGHPGPRPCILDRVDNILDKIKADIVFVFYGMNDPIFREFNEDNFKIFKIKYLELIRKIKKSKAKVIVMTPPPFDLYTFSLRKKMFFDYNEVLTIYSNWIVKNKNEYDLLIDSNGILNEYIRKNRRKNPKFTYGEGVHPTNLEQFEITKLILKAVFNIRIPFTPKYITDQGKLFELIKERSDLLISAYHDHINNNSNISEEIDKSKILLKEIIIEFNKLPKFNKSYYKGYKRYNFCFKGRMGSIIIPKNKDADMRWINRTEFLGDFDQADMAMVKKGWHLAHLYLDDMYGNPKAIELMNDFHDFLINEFNLNSKVVLFGFSRGGLYSLNYAATYPSKVDKIYLDAPVIDILSWPGKKNKNGDVPRTWIELLMEYNFTEDQAEEYSKKNWSRAEIIGKKNIDILIVAGDSDTSVPLEENGLIFYNLYKKYSDKISLIVKENCGHHPHSLKDISEIVKFLEKK